MEFGILLFGIYDDRNCEFERKTEDSSTQVHNVDSDWQHHYDVCRSHQRLYCKKQPGELAGS